MDESIAVSAIAHQIQLAVAPVFLLAGIGGFLNVMAHRLARVVDRSRQLETDTGESESRHEAELKLLARRMRVANLSIACCTASALFVCVVVAILFVADPAEIAFARPIALLFIVAMLFLILGLLLFLYEVQLAMQALRLRPRGRRAK